MKKAQKSGFLTRLAKNQRGNTAVLAGAMVFPMMAMIGGAVDISRVAMARARLQNACDAGALAARRSMTGNQPTSADITEGNKFFDSNYPSDSFGTTDIARSYEGNSEPGVIKGTAQAELPAIGMYLYRQEPFAITVNCTSTMNIPNTDVVFVLDVSGSMSSVIPGDSITKMAGLKEAVKDFFRELGPGEASGPGRIRYGFVPYATNVNVGRVLETSMMPDTAPYRTRIATIGQVWTYVLGAESGLSSWSAWSPTSTPATYNTATGFTGWARLGSTPSTTINVSGTNYRYRHATATTSTTCAATNTLAGSGTTMVARVDNAGTITSASLQSTTNNPATYSTPTPPNQQVLTYNRRDPRTVQGYRYRWQSVSGTNGCWLERATANYDRTQTATSTRSITWTQMDRVTGWTYGVRNVDISGLKNGTNWNNTLTIPATTSTSMNVNLSGVGSTSIDVPAAQTLPWRGCIEEAQSLNTITATSPLQIPANAFDLQMDLVPTTDAQRWKPHLAELVWGPNYSNTFYQHSNSTDVCVTAASRLTQYTSDVNNGLSTSFAAYVDGLVANGNTQHDIGMIWGARLLSPDGIHSAANNDASAPGGFQIGRHLVFMTDGAMNARNRDYGPWGVARLDGRQVPTTQLDANDGGGEAMNNIHYRRMEMICAAAKAKGYTVWVIGFGIPSLPQSLQNCATSAEHAAVSTSAAALKAKFRAIAETIGGLRLSL